jgi:tRNA (guanine-N7-)-methyltransferase
MDMTGRGIKSLTNEERPRFRDHTLDDFGLPGLNPHAAAHMTYGKPVLTATQAATYYGRWHEAFGRKAPMVLEVGCGNGFFLNGVSEMRPDHNMLGIEIRYKRVMLTGRKLRASGRPHALVARYDGWFLDDLFQDGDLHGINVNHPDPWPKGKHEKNRLLSRPFLEDAARFLQPGGYLRVKSDFKHNIDRTEAFIDRTMYGEPLKPLPFEIVGREDDVNANGAPWVDDVQTNYQNKFLKKGLPVYAIELKRL